MTMSWKEVNLKSSWRRLYKGEAEPEVQEKGN